MKISEIKKIIKALEKIEDNCPYWYELRKIKKWLLKKIEFIEEEND